MIIIKDAMVIIHLAKLSLLKKSCSFFQSVIMPQLVYQEILRGKEKGFSDIPIILELIEDKEIFVKKVEDKSLIKKINQWNIQRGEAEVIALYWQEKADLIATDDDNVRKKKNLLNIKVIGTPSIVLKLYKDRIIDDTKLRACASELRRIGWFSDTVLDKTLMEVKNG